MKFCHTALQPAYIGPDPHTLGRRRKKTREEFQQELFLRKRSRKNLWNFNLDSIDFGNMEHDSDFASDDDDENFFIPHSRSKCQSFGTDAINYVVFTSIYFYK